MSAKHMRCEGVDPRDTEWEDDVPVYRVYFWSQPPAPDGIRQELVMWHSDEWRITDAADVHEVLAWANERVSEGGRYTLYVEIAGPDGLGLLHLAGVDPTAAPEP